MRDSGPLIAAREQMEHDNRARVVERLHGIMVEGSKGLAVLCSGGAVAVMALVQSLLGKNEYPAFKPYAAASLCCFLLAAFLATIPFFFHYAQIAHEYSGTGRGRVWRTVVRYILVSSAIFGFVGGALIAVGMWLYL